MSDDNQEPESIPLSDLRSDLDEGADRESEAEGPDTEDRGEPDGIDDHWDADATERDGSEPLSGLRESVTGDRGESESEATEAFVEEEVESVDSQSVWADLLMEEGGAEGQFEAESTDAGADGPTQVISKGICERCTYVAPPPELSCTHDGTTIHELVDVDHVRVSNCPMVGPDGEKRSPDRD